MTDDFSNRTEKFISWLQSNHVHVSPKVQITDLRSINQGRGLIAVQDIKLDETLFTIPRNILINVANNALIKTYPDLYEKLLKLDHWHSLIIILLYEWKCIGKASKWSEYLDVLPINDEENYQFDQLVFWMDEELEYLKPSLILQRVGKKSGYDLFAKIQSIVQELGIVELKDVALDVYEKVAAIIMSYSFDVESPDATDSDNEDEADLDEEQVDGNILKDGYFKSMVPLADTLNADTNLNNAVLTYSPTDLIMTSIKTIKKGEQIYNTYSDHPNSEILRRYGYVEPSGSKFDFGEIPLLTIKAHFIKKYEISDSFINEILTDISKASKQSQEEDVENDDEVAEIVLDSYDCFKSHEVIMEFVFLIQILTIVFQTNRSELNNSDIYKRIFKKCYQLVESKRLTNGFVENYKETIEERLSEYPRVASEPFGKSMDVGRKAMAEAVLKSEYQSLKNCLDVEKTLKETLGSYKLIEDEKLIRNIVKKRPTEDGRSGQKNKKSKR
ncbi:RKM4 [[Candida] subhashii]|uniref:Ribosomal lysine N-methyltransferase 4 n=1 Tax=[Candida] subhashii TaxID=561895 RepID=A0A8J5QQC9_9ASCO|nr:RKM4 [[Candida] subhashii]KAG7663532.1 RKM4 [[Candida] subhashii]